MRYVIARINQYQRDWAYRIYVTDALKFLANLNIRYEDLFAPPETRTAEEVISNVKNKLKLLK